MLIQHTFPGQRGWGLELTAFCPAYELWFLGQVLDLSGSQSLHAQDGEFIVLPSWV